MDRQFEFLKSITEVDDATVQKLEKAEAERKQVWKKQELESHYKNTVESGVNARYWNESLETYRAETDEEKNNLATVKKYAEDTKTFKTLLMFGNYGTGKTHLGCAIIRERGGKYIPSLKLCIEYETGTDFKAQKNRLQILNEYSNLPMLVIDEIGRGLKTQTEKEILAYVLNERYEKLLPTVLISNMNKQEFVKFIGMPIFDRMKETAISLNFTGKSRRTEKRTEI